MIVNQVRGDIFAGSHKHIAFAVNTHGYNDKNIAEVVADLIRPQRLNNKLQELGDVITYKSGVMIYYALVCRSSGLGGWNDTPLIVRECLDKIASPENEEIAVVLMGSGLVGKKQGANLEAILKGMELSKKKLAVYMP